MSSDEVIRNQKHACDRCRRSKLRCLVDTVKEYGKCRRCYDTGKDCMFELMAPRQQRKRIDTRLSDLENQVAMLKAAFEVVHPKPNAPCSMQSEPIQQHEESSDHSTCVVRSTLSTGRGSVIAEIPTQPTEHYSSMLDPIPGLLNSASLPYDTAAYLFAKFVDCTLPEYPVLVLGEWDNFNSLRSQKPILLFAMIVAACRGYEPTLFHKLSSLLAQVLAQRIVVDGERTLELLQAALLISNWYDPPDDLRRLNFYLWIQISATMAHQLSLFGDPRLSTAVPGDKANYETRERCRTAIAVYLGVSTVAISSRRSCLIQLPRNVREILVNHTKTSVDTHDRCLGAWMDLQAIAEDIEVFRLSCNEVLTTPLDDLTSPTDPIQQLEERLDLFKQTLGPSMNLTLLVHFSWTQTKLYEVAILYHTTTKTFSSTQKRSARRGRGRSAGTSTNLGSYILRLISVCHQCINTVILSDRNSYTNSPTVATVRALYAIKSLIALRQLVQNSQSPLLEAIDIPELLLETYIDRLETFFTVARGSEGHRVPHMALSMIVLIRERFCRDSDNTGPNGTASIIPQLVPDTHAREHDNELDGVTNSTLDVIVGVSREVASSQTTGHGVGGTDGRLPISGWPASQSSLPTSYTTKGAPEIDLFSMPDNMLFSDVLFTADFNASLSNDWSNRNESQPNLEWPI